MKKIFIAALAALAALGASAQRASESTSFSLWDSESVDKSVVIGIRGGLNISNFSLNSEMADEMADPDSKIGYRFGVSVDFPIVSSFYINSGLFYSTKGIKIEEKDGGDYMKETVNMGYLEIPVYASYRVNFASQSQLQINFGPYFALGVNGKAKDEYRSDYLDEVEKEEYDVFKKGDDGLGFKRFDCGLGIGAGYTFHKFYLGFDYQFGLTNLLDKKEWGSDMSAKNSNFNISIGYNF